MNPLGNGNALPPEVLQNIQQIKQIMQTTKQTPEQLLQQLGAKNPEFSSIMQMCKGQNLEQVFYSLAQAKGINPQAILNALK